MRDVFKTAKQGQMAPVRGRVKAMMAQPKNIFQARKIARQTTGFQKGGHVKKASHKWTAEQFGGGEKGKPHSTQEGRIAAGERLFKRFWNKKREEDKKRRMGPGAPARPKEAGMNVKKGGVMEKRKVYKLANKLKNKDRLTQRDIQRAEKLIKSSKTGQLLGTAKGQIDKFLKAVKKEPSLVGKKKGGKVDKKWIQKAVNPKHKGYCTPMTKKTCTPRRKALARTFKKKAKKGWANGGTVVMPTVGNDVRTRAYKQGALIHPRPRPTTVLHGRARGVGIAKRGW